MESPSWKEKWLLFRFLTLTPGKEQRRQFFYVQGVLRVNVIRHLLNISSLHGPSGFKCASSLSDRLPHSTTMRAISCVPRTMQRTSSLFITASNATANLLSPHSSQSRKGHSYDFLHVPFHRMSISAQATLISPTLSSYLGLGCCQAAVKFLTMNPCDVRKQPPHNQHSGFVHDINFPHI